MFEDETRVLIVLSRDLVDRARGIAGRATTSIKLPVSLQIVFRALIEEGLKRPGDPTLLGNVGRQAEAVRLIRSGVRRRLVPASTDGHRPVRRRPAAGSRRSG
jgi:hypothetical protein